MPLEIPGREKIKNEQKKAQKSDLSREKHTILRKNSRLNSKKTVKKEQRPQTIYMIASMLWLLIQSTSH